MILFILKNKKINPPMGVSWAFFPRFPPLYPKKIFPCREWDQGFHTEKTEFDFIKYFQVIGYFLKSVPIFGPKRASKRDPKIYLNGWVVSERSFLGPFLDSAKT